ncbi:16026_t:CDS:2 [Acaulospora colombiana]|uniref:16026_t:CDS:1 n=1 Tax=Acaulospora colombiana TaxID=27376 RepID=A0ACA9MX10_9GLOM|nr:16026_t:CDS:2 [Acaulospora colombiana]
MAGRRTAFYVLSLALVRGAAAAGGHLDEKARITLACLLGGVPALSMILLLLFCIWIHKRKRKLRKHALANGIELDQDGWPVPVQHSQANSNAELPTYQPHNQYQSSTNVHSQTHTASRPTEDTHVANPVTAPSTDTQPETKVYQVLYD